MTDGTVQVSPDSTGKIIDQTELTVGANTVERQRIVIAGALAAQLADVLNTIPTGNEYGLVTRNVPGLSDLANQSVLLLILGELQCLRTAFQDWSGTNPRFDPSNQPAAVVNQ